MRPTSRTWQAVPMPTERDEEQAAVDTAIEQELHHERTRDAAAEQGLLDKHARDESRDD